MECWFCVEMLSFVVLNFFSAKTHPLPKHKNIYDFLGTTFVLNLTYKTKNMDQEQAFALFGLIEFLGLTLIFWLLKDTKWFGWLWTCWWVLWIVFIGSLFVNKGKKSIKEWWDKD